MKRRIFVKLVTTATAGMYLPVVGCNAKDKKLTSMLSQPNALQHICDAETIREIGKAYQKRVPVETRNIDKITGGYIDHTIDESTESSLVNYVLVKSPAGLP
jgi:hypothetical protein